MSLHAIETGISSGLQGYLAPVQTLSFIYSIYIKSLAELFFFYRYETYLTDLNSWHSDSWWMCLCHETEEYYTRIVNMYMYILNEKSVNNKVIIVNKGLQVMS